MRAATGINGAKDLLSQEEVSNDQLGALTAGVFVVSAILAIASGALIGGNVGASFTYIFAVLPIVFLGVGSSSPGVIVALYGIVRGAAEDVSERRRRHEVRAFGGRLQAGVTGRREFGRRPPPRRVLLRERASL